jgi:hypothetical protein
MKTDQMLTFIANQISNGRSEYLDIYYANRVFGLGYATTYQNFLLFLYPDQFNLYFMNRAGQGGSSYLIWIFVYLLIWVFALMQFKNTWFKKTKRDPTQSLKAPIQNVSEQPKQPEQSEQQKQSEQSKPI